MSKRQVQRIFVVDDERVIAETLATILQQWGFAAKFFTDPLEALKSARLEVPDLLISDVMMPQLLGTDLAVQMKELCPSCKILLLSGQANTIDLLRTSRARGHDFRLLSKPVHPIDLCREIGSLEGLCASAAASKSHSTHTRHSTLIS